jgi:hypothetical protein
MSNRLVGVSLAVGAVVLAASSSCASSASDAPTASEESVSLPVTSGSKDPLLKDQKAIDAARTCLEQAVGKPRRSEGESLKTLVATAVQQCLGKAGSEELWNQSGALPFAIAIHTKTNRDVRLTYYCSDVCPNYGHVLAILADVPLQECCDIGQIPLRDPGWGGYQGCAPAELASDGERKRAVCGPPPTGQ